METAALVLADSILVLGVAVALRWVLGRLRQPPVMADILAGLVLGATLLGALPGDPSGALFDSESRSVLRGFGEAAIVAYLFSAAARFDLTALRTERRIVGGVAAGSFVVPWIAGAGLAVGVHRTAALDVALVPFALFFGTAMAVTAVPVLARIIGERSMEDVPAARIALAAASLQEVVVWPVLAIAVAGAGSSRPPAGVLLTGVVSLVGVVALARLAGRALSRAPRAACGVVALILLGLAAMATQGAGLHLFAGAMLFGVALPSPVRDAALAILDSPPLRRAQFVCLPLFFALPALDVDVWALGGDDVWLLATVLSVAVTAKFGSAALFARWAGAPHDEALTVGALMNARGLVELVVLSVGLDAGLIDERLFSIMVLMALVTTFATGPLVDRLDRRRRRALRRAALIGSEQRWGNP